ncbi:MAG: hypothetical protein GF400_08370 [Candidatus Eisenbacteria bacterium]|nr:hypothetical protein [Candidatus Eisenbacteria bacterium]
MEEAPMTLRGILSTLTLCAAALAAAASPCAASRSVGDTLTVIARPILAIPQIAAPGQSFTIEARAPSSAGGWSASLVGAPGQYPLSVDGAAYNADHERWFIDVTVPPDAPEEIYDLSVEASGGIVDSEAHAVMVRQSIGDDYYFVQITDTHLPTHKYYYQQGADTDTSEMEDLHAVIDDLNIINPAFVLLTGDVVNEGELEDFLDKRYYTRAKRILERLEVPVYVCAGNHDVGGWEDTPPSDGTARRNWWKFFGWNYLNDPPAADNVYTQNYSFDYGGAHFVSLEAYNNYDRWRRSLYGDDSFTTRQILWLNSDLSAVPTGTPVVAFYHMDFRDQLDLDDLGIDCALWGHVHYTSGSIHSHPYDLSTETVCDGERAMRVVRVQNGGTIVPSEPISAGPTGFNLRLAFEHPNDGTRTENAASIVNNQPKDFEQALIKFRMSAESAPYEVDDGELFQTVIDGDVAVCYVRLNALSGEINVVNISPEQGSGISDGAGALLSLIRPSFPNPATSHASLGFSLSRPAEVRVEVYDVLGRRVRDLACGARGPGEHEIRWDLRDDDGSRVSSGVYMWRVESDGEVLRSQAAVLR